MQYFTASVTWSVPVGITKVWAACVGGGGGGGAGSGGSGGAYAEGVLDITGLSTLKIFVGQGGTGGGAFVNGGDSKFAGASTSITGSGGNGGGTMGGSGGAGVSGSGGSYQGASLNVDNTLNSNQGTLPGCSPFQFQFKPFFDDNGTPQAFYGLAQPGKGGDTNQAGTNGFVMLKY